MKIRPVGAELFHADGQTHRQTDRQTELTKLIVTFHNFAKAPRNEHIVLDIALGSYICITLDIALVYCILYGT
jgi:hypothetical protein